MPRPSALASVPLSVLQAEIQRRVSKLDALLKLKADVDRQIAELQTLAGQFVKAAPVAPVVKAVRTRRRKAKAVTVVAQPVVKKVTQTAAQFVLGLLAGGKVRATKEFVQAWKAAGRTGKVNIVLTKLVKAKRVERREVPGQRGSNYSLAGAVEPVAKKQGRPSAYAQTAPEFVLGLFAGGKVLTTKDLARAWGSAGRKGKVDKVVSVLVKANKLTRRKITGGQGSNYSLAGAVATPVVTPVVKKPGKKTFTCPTCRTVFDSGPKLGAHYTTEPTHRQK